MRLITFAHGDRSRVGVALSDAQVLDLGACGAPALAGRCDDMLDFIAGGDAALAAARQLAAAPPAAALRRRADVQLLAPILRPRRNVFCVGRNYFDHVKEGDRARAAKRPACPNGHSSSPRCRRR